MSWIGLALILNEKWFSLDMEEPFEYWKILRILRRIIYVNRNIPLISPDLLAVLHRMGHGDEIVLADAHFPGDTFGKRVLRADGLKIPNSLDELINYKKSLENQRNNFEQIENEIQSVASCLTSLQSNIENASFEEKYNAISALVKSITVNKNTVGAKDTPVVTITYRFNDPESITPLPIPTPAIVKDCTPVLADIMVTHSSHVPVRLQW